jgi:cell division protein FtsB
MRQLKEFVNKLILEILIVLVGAVASILWVFNATIAAQEVKINTSKEQDTELKADLESLRQENRAEHQKIIDLLMQKK